MAFVVKVKKPDSIQKCTKESGFVIIMKLLYCVLMVHIHLYNSGFRFTEVHKQLYFFIVLGISSDKTFFFQLTTPGYG